MLRSLNPEEFCELRENVTHSSTEELDVQIKEIWDSVDEVAPMDRALKTEVLCNIHRDMPAVRKINPFYPWFKRAAVVFIPLLLVFGTYWFASSRQAVQTFIVVADRGQKSQIYLPDGTCVWLNSGSRLTYTSAFNSKNRTVQLEGEAFFDVEKKDKQHFTVQTGAVDVRVHGTAFNVSSYADEPDIRVSLTRGSIDFSHISAPSSFVGLKPNQLATISKGGGEWRIEHCDPDMESLWTQNKLKFENAPAHEVFQKLERWYGMNIEIENMDSSICYGFTLKNESMRETLQLIHKVTPIHYDIDGEEVHITYK